MDSPGLVRYLSEHGKHFPSLRERVESELVLFKLFLAEELVVPLKPGGARFEEGDDSHLSNTSVGSGEKCNGWDRRSAR